MCGGIDIGCGYDFSPPWIGWNPGEGDRQSYTYWIDKDLSVFTDTPLTDEELEAMKKAPDLVRRMLKLEDI